jgi:hypothetical protein
LNKADRYDAAGRAGGDDNFHPVGRVLIPYNLPITRAAQYLRTYTYKLCTAAIASIIFIHTETAIVLAEDRVGDINEQLSFDV